MSLTKDDLAAIQHIVQVTVQPMIDDLAQDTAAGFAEVHEKLAGMNDEITQVKERLDGVESRLSSVENTVSRIENVQRAEASRVDRHEKDLTLIKRKLSIA